MLNVDVNQITQNVQNISFDIPHEKTNVLFFTRHNIPKISNIQFSNINFPVVNEVKY